MSMRSFFTSRLFRRCGWVSPSALACILFVLSTTAHAALPSSAPALPGPAGQVVNVSTQSQFLNACNNAASNTSIVLAPGTYTIGDACYLNGTFANVEIRGATSNYDDVVINGNRTSPYGIWTGGNVTNILIANLTIKSTVSSPIQLNPGTHAPHIYHVHLIDAGEQFIKGTPGVDAGLVEYSTMEYVIIQQTSPGYTNGVDLKGPNWIVRHNLFQNIQAPSGSGLLAGPAILAFQGASNATIESNTFINCQREIAMGLVLESGYNDNTGGIVRNNFIYRAATVANSDVSIGIADSPNTKIYNNTVLINGTYPNAIEYRYSTTTGTLIRNNLLDGAILARSGATGTASNNVTAATASLFLNPTTGDMHLKVTAAIAIDKAVALSEVTTDWDGTTRPTGAGPDMGADEQGTGAAIPSAPTNLRIVPGMN